MTGGSQADAGNAIAVINSTTIAVAGNYDRYFWIGYFNMANGNITASQTFGSSTANSTANTILFATYLSTTMVCLAGNTGNNAAIICKNAVTFVDLFNYTTSCSPNCTGTGLVYDSKGPYLLLTGNLNGTFAGVNSNPSLTGFYLAVYNTSFSLMTSNFFPNASAFASAMNPSNGKLYITGGDYGPNGNCTIYTAVPSYCANTTCDDGNPCTTDTCDTQLGCVYQITCSPSSTPSRTPSITPTNSPTASRSTTPSVSATPSPVASPSMTPSRTPTPSVSVTPTPSVSVTPSSGSSSSPTASPATLSSTPSISPTPTSTDASSSQSSGSGQSALIGIIAGLAVGFFLVVTGGIAGLVFFMKRNRKDKMVKEVELVSPEIPPTQYRGSGGYANNTPGMTLFQNNSSTQYSSGPVPQTRSTSTPTPSAKKGWEIEFTELKIDKKIGSGAFGEVFKAKWRGIDVAVKKLISDQNATQIRDFFTEAEVMKNLKSHLNITQLYGVCENPLCIVTEFVNNGNLLEKLKARSLNDDTKIRIASGIAAGMMHLHSEGICHRDLAARNILLDSNMNPKVCDFGMSRVALDSQVNKTNTTVGPIRWMAPEALAHQVYNTKTDVWSYGVILFEILTAKVPYAHLDLMQACGAVMAGSVSLLSEVNDSTSPEILVAIMKKCLQRDPQDRPDFTQIMGWFDAQS